MMTTRRRPFVQRLEGGGRGRHADFQHRMTISPLLSQTMARGTGRLGKPRQS